ncbi:hypothetical protein [Hymenobacter latericus]|uniref:hypothetical protein n=1 Tax=Hymenobacter sp. YIM 151858-1 TaxID=2987688 RepID=UPI0022264D66|nr:hypothetical protein [Hymenobacter sp. YIM 151858-1]UYZ61146.1 hypothetical protein OIS50_19445 [Hymenobacter sp. YIM 151858-1]
MFFVRLLLLGCLVLGAFTSRGQHQEAAQARALGFTLFRIPFQDSTLTFLVSGVDLDRKPRKPVVLLCQGGGARPLITTGNSGAAFMGWPFDLKAYQGRYHFVVIARPGVPLVAERRLLSREQEYLEVGTDAPPAAYLERDTRGYHVQAARQVLRYLRRQSWVDRRLTAVVGGGQGCHVATRLATADRHVTHLAFYGAMPAGPLPQLVHELREAQLQRRLTPASAQRRIDSVYAAYQSLIELRDPAAMSGVAWRNTVSLARYPAVDELPRVRVPLLIAYGTAEPSAWLLDQLPLEFARRGQRNLTLLPYPGLDERFLLTGRSPQEPPRWYGNVAWADLMNWLAGAASSSNRPGR